MQGEAGVRGEESEGKVGRVAVWWRVTQLIIEGGGVQQVGLADSYKYIKFGDQSAGHEKDHKNLHNNINAIITNDLVLFYI